MSSLGQTFTRKFAIAGGMTDRDLAAMVDGGTVIRLARGIYQAATLPSLEPAAINAMAMTPSHQTAAAWWGADMPFESPPHATVPRNRRRRTRWDGLTVHRADLSCRDIATFRGVQLTTATRTVVDIARCAPITEAVAIGDSLCRLGRTTKLEVEQAAAGLPNGVGRPAARRVAALLDPLAESVFESMTRVQIVTAGLPAPVLQYSVVCDGRWLARVDFAWPEQRVILECDGFEFHGSREAFERDRRRWNELTRAGWRVIVVTWRQIVADPTYVARVIGEVLSTTTHS
jgi:hypothetical protein